MFSETPVGKSDVKGEELMPKSPEIQLFMTIKVGRFRVSILSPQRIEKFSPEDLSTSVRGVSLPEFVFISLY